MKISLHHFDSFHKYYRMLALHLHPCKFSLRSFFLTRTVYFFTWPCSPDLSYFISLFIIKIRSWIKLRQLETNAGAQKAFDN